MIVIGVSHRKINKKLGSNAKKYYFLYYYDENLVLHSQRIGLFEAVYRKFQKKKTFRFTCPTCERSFKAINQKKSNIRCPYCD